MIPSVWAPRGLDLEMLRLRDAFDQAAAERDEVIAQRDEYLRHIHKLQAALDKVKHDRNRAILGKNALGDILDEYAEMLGKPQDEVMARYKEQLKRESERQGIPLD